MRKKQIFKEQRSYPIYIYLYLSVMSMIFTIFSFIVAFFYIKTTVSLTLIYQVRMGKRLVQLTLRPVGLT